MGKFGIDGWDWGQGINGASAFIDFLSTPPSGEI